MQINQSIFLEPDASLFECPDAQRSYSPFYSSVGLLTKDGDTGIGALALHYNRATRFLFRKTVSCPLPYNGRLSDIAQLVCGNGELQLSFFDRNAFTVECATELPVALFSEPDPRTTTLWFEQPNPKSLSLYGYSQNGDDRDPDAKVPFRIALEARKGFFFTVDGTPGVLPEDGTVLFHAVIHALEINAAGQTETLRTAPRSAAAAAEKTRAWIRETTRDFRLSVCDPEQIPKIRASVLGLLMNLTLAEGDLKQHISAFPNRGTYPTHFLWDTCFQNLAYEKLSLALAKDLLLQNIDLQRSDGKYPQFLCSTWARPHDTQPALIGWAALRLARKTKDLSFAEKALFSIEKNNDWWLTQRLTPCGLVYTLGGLETGQDNSPRFDNGPTIAADMNAYVLHQMLAAAALAEMLGDTERSRRWTGKAEAFSALLKNVLYDRKDQLFYDRDLKTGEVIRVISPSALLPLWAGPVLPEVEAKTAISRHLLNPEEMFGEVPFPSVAYNDPHYNAADWWRGPTWMPIAFLMLECLDRYGFTKEKQLAAERLYRVIAADPDIRELFDSRTGKGMGAAQQGWTCAIFLEFMDSGMQAGT